MKFDTLVESYLINEEQIENSVAQFILFVCEDESILNESKANDFLKKIGLHTKKSKGLLDYLKQAGIGFFNLFKAITAPFFSSSFFDCKNGKKILYSSALTKYDNKIKT